MFAIVDHKKELSCPDGSRDRGCVGLPAAQPDVEDARDGGWHQMRIREGSEVYKVGVDLRIREHALSDLQRQSRLADSPWAGQRHHAVSGQNLLHVMSGKGAPEQINRADRQICA